MSTSNRAWLIISQLRHTEKSMETVAAQIITFRNLLPAQDTVFYKNAQELDAVVQLTQPQIKYQHH